jgi:hypothetical protein
MPWLGMQKPLELFAEIIIVCPRGQDNNILLFCLYLNKLPRELCMLLADVDMADKHLLGSRADQLWTHKTRLTHDTVAAVA